MAVSLSEDFEDCDVFVVGAGLAGLAAAIDFARAGFSVVSCGAADRLGQGRTVTLLGRSIDLLKGLDIWRDVEPLAAPLRSLRIIDDTGALFPPRPVEFHADEIGLDAFGWNIENAALADMLAKAAAALPVGRVGVGEDIARQILTFMTVGFASGSIVYLDGGALVT